MSAATARSAWAAAEFARDAGLDGGSDDDGGDFLPGLMTASSTTHAQALTPTHPHTLATSRTPHPSPPTEVRLEQRGGGGGGAPLTFGRQRIEHHVPLLVALPRDPVAPTSAHEASVVQGAKGHDGAGPKRVRPFKLPTNCERHLLSEHAMATMQTPSSGLISTPQGMRFVVRPPLSTQPPSVTLDLLTDLPCNGMIDPPVQLPPAATDVKTHGASIFLHRLSADSATDEWISSLSHRTWAQSRAAAAAEDAAAVGVVAAAIGAEGVDAAVEAAGEAAAAEDAADVLAAARMAGEAEDGAHSVVGGGADDDFPPYVIDDDFDDGGDGGAFDGHDDGGAFDDGHALMHPAVAGLHGAVDATANGGDGGDDGVDAAANGGDDGDDLTRLLAARQQHLDADASMRVQVEAMMAARMDVGVRVNASLAHALGVRAGSGGAEEDGDEVERADTNRHARMQPALLAPSRADATVSVLAPRITVAPPTRHSLIRILGEWSACHVPTAGDAPPACLAALVATANATCPPGASPPSAQRILLALLWTATTHNTTTGARTHAPARAPAASMLAGARLPAGRQMELRGMGGDELLIALWDEEV